MTTYTPDFSKRTKTTQHYAGVNAGFYCDFRHVTGVAQTNIQICPAGSVVTLLSINIAGTASTKLKCGNDIVGEFLAVRDYKMGFYAYAPIFLDLADATIDVTVYFTVPAKGQAAGS